MTTIERQSRMLADTLSLKENQDVTKEELVALIEPFMRATFSVGVRNGADDMRDEILTAIERQERSK